MKIVFMGTPDFAAASLRALLDWPGGQVAAVYCQPDRPAGRGQALQTGPVKALALERNLPVLQPENFRQPEELERLAAFGADIFVVAAYGLILPKALLDLPPLGAINVHGSLLPEYRGAAPIQRAIMAGDIRTGISIMRVEPKLDSGPVLLQRAMAIGVDQTAGELHDELALLGGELLVQALERMSQGRLTEQVQDENLVTYAAKLTKADGVLDFNLTARQVHNQARGVTPWPGAQITFERLPLDQEKAPAKNQDLARPQGQAQTQPQSQILPPIKALIEAGRVLVETGPTLSDFCSALAGTPYLPGTVLPLQDDCLPVVCADGLYGIERLRPAGGKSMSAAAFANGYLKNCQAGAIW
ncbi:MAG: methionyl-tRNA formyltransferase [Deltaproteobacteria bacterium]|jgi:methionyl-tRNA formyltransferase|nr:methionyl-tRNA formyltransferase [Deltaproteobacteria bacterium]